MMRLTSAARKVVRATAFFTLVGLSLIEGVLLLALTPRRERRRMRAEWLHRWCKRYQWLLAIHPTTEGELPAAGLLVCNHLSYLDIIVLGAAMRCVFVSKRRCRTWPIFGLCAQLAGTIFVDRERKGEVDSVAAQMEEVLRDGLLLVLFPEGTSSDGRQVLPFKTPLFEPVARLVSPATGAAPFLRRAGWLGRGGGLLLG
jgi:1-acyl-sn-glycerol-3-phosphate acyltransferase